MLTVVLIVLALLIIVGLVWFIRARMFKPTKDKRVQLEKINQLIAPFGFSYTPNGDYFYALYECWQRKVGYCRLYDEGAPFFNMIMDCEPIPFTYDGKRWLIELWKGQYGVTTGAEIGIYNTSRTDVASPDFTGTYYENIKDDEMLKLSFVLRRNGQTLIKRRAIHWWLTGFVLGMFSEPDMLSMDVHIRFRDAVMRDAFVQSLEQIGYQPDEYSLRFRRSVLIHFNKPHTPQPATQLGPQRLIAQGLNQSNCSLYKSITAPYTDTLDRLEYLISISKNLFDFFLNSLYPKQLFDAFERIAPLLLGLTEQETEQRDTVSVDLSWLYCLMPCCCCEADCECGD